MHVKGARTARPRRGRRFERMGARIPLLNLRIGFRPTQPGRSPWTWRGTDVSLVSPDDHTREGKLRRKWGRSRRSIDSWSRIGADRLRRKNSPLWQTYEEQVAELVAALDGNAEVIHNKRVEARLSKAMRQVDVWVQGEIIRQKIVIVVECKFTSRPLEIGVVDEFVGKLLDLGADRGVLYSASGMTSNAVWRAQMATNPSVIPVTLEPAPPRAPGYPAGFDEADYAGWLDRGTYRRLLMSRQWSPWFAREVEMDPRWEDVWEEDYEDELCA
jgi:hypothetical protein